MKRLIALAMAAALLMGCSAGGGLGYVSEALNMELSGEVVSSEDSHGGFHGDGTSFIVIQFEDDSFTGSIKGDPDWPPLPLTENLTALTYGVESEVQTESGIHSVSYGPYLTGGGGEALFPPIASGYYYFVDRHPQSTDPKDDSHVLDRGSLNFTLAIYDAESNTLYFSKMDT